MRNTERTILEVLDALYVFLPVKIYFNDKFILYNDYDSTIEVAPGVFGENSPPETAVPLRLKSVLDKYDVYIDRVDLRVVSHHHSIIYLYGTRVVKYE